jgi:hypothetical protein
MAGLTRHDIDPDQSSLARLLAGCQDGKRNAASELYLYTDR